MAIPTIRAVGTVHALATAISPGLPAGTVAGDLLVMFLTTRDQTITVSGWTQLPFQSPQTIAGTTRLTIFYKVAAGGDATTTSDSGSFQLGRIIGITAGTFDSASPFNASGAGGTESSVASVTIPGFTTTVADCLILAGQAANLPASTGTTEYSSPANADLSSVTEQIDNSTAQGVGGALLVVSGGKASAGAFGNTTASAVNTASRCYIALAVQPPQVAGFIRSRPTIGASQAAQRASRW